MTGKLPKGALKPLAKIIGPLSLWMAAGWAVYPNLIERVYDAMNEPLDIAEAQLFSYIIVPVFIILGIVLIIHGYTGKEVPDAKINAMNPERWPCPKCLKPQAASNVKCDNCGVNLEK